ncbi:5235_t:CDS:2 [Entrophospora sp. SA101]|nr:5235_t:CDS:2 [Entrophospora sp. SA101]
MELHIEVFLKRLASHYNKIIVKRNDPKDKIFELEPIKEISERKKVENIIWSDESGHRIFNNDGLEEL